jgi:transposase
MKTKTQQPHDWREARRLRAVELKAQGWKQRDIAAAFDVTEGAVSQWLKQAAEGGGETVRRRGKRGVKPKLSAEQLHRLPDLLRQGATHFGFGDAVWTQGRVAWLIEQQFGVRYHPAHVGRLLKQLKWSRQKPVERASQRDEVAIERWRLEKWPELEKKRGSKGGG